MVKILKAVTLVFLINMFYLSDSYSQQQPDIREFLTQRFLAYCNKVPREEMYLHSDRENYIAGEDLWFNLYLIDRRELSSLKQDKIAYFELLNQENRPIIQRKIFLDEGFGPGHIILPDTLSSGIYTLRAYTNWMKNFLPENCFIQEIRIFNAFNKKEFKGKTYSNVKSQNAAKLSESGNGPELVINNSNPAMLDLIITTDNNYRSANNNTLYVFIQTHGIINHVSKEQANTDSTTIRIDRKELTPGLNHITLFNLLGEPILERYLYTTEIAESDIIVAASEKVKTRSKISLEISNDEIPYSKLNKGNLSISVIPESNMSVGADIKEYLIFGSEFGLVPKSILNGRRIEDLPSDALDTLLLALKSNWINWDLILSGDLPSIRYMPETIGHFLTGSLLSQNKGLAAPGELMFMSTPGKVASFQYAFTDDEASFNFSVPIDNYDKDLVIQPSDESGGYSVKIESPFSEKYFESESLPGTDNSKLDTVISRLSVNYQVGKIYESKYISDSTNQFFPASVVKRFYGRPDIELIMADYIKLPVMDEVFFELLPGAFLRNKKTGYEISISDPITNDKFNIPPILMIDGVIIKDPALIAEMDPDLVEEIDVVRERYFVGDYLFYGLINVITKDGDFSLVNLPDHATRIQHRTIDPASSFVSPDYTLSKDKSDRIPDFRNTLYWNPSVKPDEDGKSRIEFWSSDVRENYQIVIQGFTPAGKLVSFRKIIQVE